MVPPVVGWAGMMPEPPAADNPLLANDNFILTSHIGAFTQEANEKMALVSAQNLIRMMTDG